MLSKVESPLRKPACCREKKPLSSRYPLNLSFTNRSKVLATTLLTEMRRYEDGSEMLPFLKMPNALASRHIRGTTECCHDALKTMVSISKAMGDALERNWAWTLSGPGAVLGRRQWAAARTSSILNVWSRGEGKVGCRS